MYGAAVGAAQTTKRKRSMDTYNVLSTMREAGSGITPNAIPAQARAVVQRNTRTGMQSP